MNSIFAVLLAFASAAAAENVSVPIPGEGWHIAFDAPHLLDHANSTNGDGGYAFRANGGMFNLSFFVEKPSGKGTTNNDVYAFYWPQASRNPMIDKASIAKSETPRYVRVQYDVVVQFEGQNIHQRNVNYYFAYRGWWMDVHISIIDPHDADQATLDAFDKSLSYAADAAKSD